MEQASGSSSEIVDRVAAVCRRHDLLAPNDRVLVAVSGGADSSALAGILARLTRSGLPLALELAHVDHGWRSRRDAALDLEVVRGIAAREGLPLHLSGRPQRPLPETEDAARRWRYRQLAHIALSRGIATVATGHHAMDQAETVLMRLLRGSGVVGLTGIPRKRTFHEARLTVVRPLLDVDPGALRAWLAARNLRWHEDETNRDLSRDRAVVRAWLTRRIAAGGDPEAGLLTVRRQAERRLAALRAELESRVGEAFRFHETAQAVAMPRAVLRDLTTALLDLALRRAGTLLHAESRGPWLTRRHVTLAEALLAREGDLDLPAGLVLHVRGKTAWLARRRFDPPALPPLAVDVLPASGFDLAAHLAASDARLAAVDAERLGAAPRLRLLEPGDRFVPHGSSTGRERAVRAWLSKRGVPQIARRGQLVVEGDGGIAWVVGRRVDQRHLVAAETREVAVLRVEERIG